MSSISFRASTDDAALPVSQDLITVPLREMFNNDRKALGLGPTFTLMVGDTMIADNIPKRGAMGISEFLNGALVKYPRSSTIKINPEQVDPDTVTVLMDFIVGNCRVKTPFQLQKPEAFADGAKLYNHALMFGMGRYASGLRQALLKGIDSENITPYSAMNELVKLPTDDRCYVAVVRKFEGLEYIKELEGDAKWEAWLADHLSFMASMDAWKKTREARAKEAREARRAARWELDFPVLS